ncbi:MAG: Rieske (2Fe-2S) protein [Burkholderiales bacterium]
MSVWQSIVEFEDIFEGHINKVSVSGVKLILLRIDGELYAYEDACPHERHPLSLGELEGDILTCAKHLWEFEIRTGKHVSRISRPKYDLRSFGVRVVDGVVQVELPDRDAITPEGAVPESDCSG